MKKFLFLNQNTSQLAAGMNGSQKNLPEGMLRSLLRSSSLYFLYALPYLFIFLFSIYLPYDADLGWHLKYGEYFFKHGHVLYDNNFSRMMPEFKWANTSWGIDVISYAAFHLGNFQGLSILSAAIVTLTFFFFSKAFKLTLWSQTILFPIFMFLLQPINEVSMRGQQVSLLFLGILFYLLTKISIKDQWNWILIPILFLFWVNIHGEFILGLAILSAWAGIKFLVDLRSKDERNIKGQIFFWGRIVILSAVLTFVNPFGMSLYGQEVFAHIGAKELKSIAEYLPFSDLSSEWRANVVIFCLVLIGAMYLYFSDKLIPNLPFLGVTLLLAFLTFSVKRYAWPYYYTSLLFVAPFLDLFQPGKKWEARISAVLLVIILCVTFYYKNPIASLKNMSWETYCNTYIQCSKESAKFLVDHKLQNTNLFTVYNWGGYIIWNYPEIKPLIDGRMHLWKDKKGYSAFDEYYPVEQNLKDIDKTSYKTAYVLRSKPVYDRLYELAKEEKWRLVYVDDKAGIFVRNESNP